MPQPQQQSSSNRIAKLGGMFRHQDVLPRLPVPPLRQTMEQYLDQVQPLVPADVFETAKQNVATFLASPESERLHRHLVSESTRPTTKNWLNRWWSDSYLTDRNSPGINVSPTVTLDPHPEPEVQKNYILRAAILLHHTLQYHLRIKNQEIEPGSFKKKPFCMEDYLNFFNSTRVPALGRDIMVRNEHPSHHVVVMARGRVFRMDVLQEDGQPATIPVLKKRLDHIAQVVTLHPREHDPAHPDGPIFTSELGPLTALDRDEWATTRAALIGQSMANKAALASIEDAIMVVTLELDAGPELYSPAGIKCLLAGSHTVGTGSSATIVNDIPYLNRWWDKSFQLHVCSNGAAAGTFEHSAMDSLPILYWARDVHAAEVRDRVEHIGLNKEFGSVFAQALVDPKMFPFEMPTVHELLFELHPAGLKARDKGLEKIRSVLSRLDAQCTRFEKYGGKTLSKELKVSPDAFVQLALQVTFKKLRGHTPSTYESAATKTFLHGRTETLRTPSTDSVIFVEAALKGDTTPAELGVLARKAMAHHGRRARMCLDGQGCDRHLFGLVCSAGDLRLPLPRALSDTAFKTFSAISLSTTHPLALPGLAGVSFGPISNDCVGCGYEIFPNFMLISTTTWNTGEAVVFNEELLRVFKTLKKALQATVPLPPKENKQPSSKL